MDYKGKVAWITGASSGIGAALARDLSQRGAHVILSGRDETRLAQVAADCGQACVLAFDVRDETALMQAKEQALAWKGGVDIAFANAGVSQRSRALKTDMQVYRDIIDIAKVVHFFHKIFVLVSYLSEPIWSQNHIGIVDIVLVNIEVILFSSILYW